jgi:hypothetical protein
MGWSDDQCHITAYSVDGIIANFREYSQKRVVRGNGPPPATELLSILRRAQGRIPEGQRPLYRAVVQECEIGIAIGKYHHADAETLRNLTHDALRSTLIPRGDA